MIDWSNAEFLAFLSSMILLIFSSESLGMVTMSPSLVIVLNCSLLSLVLFLHAIIKLEVLGLVV